MKHKYISLILALSLTMALTGCSEKENPETEVAKDNETTVETTIESTPEAEAIGAYMEKLSSVPAIDLSSPELSDLTFGYDDNIAMFGEHIDLFAFADLNGDEVPEMITMTVVNTAWTPVSVYTFDGNNVVLLNDPMNPDANCTFEQMSTAGGSYDLYLCGDGHIHSVWAGSTPVGYMEENYAYSFDGANLVLTDCSGTGFITYFADIARTNSPEIEN